MKMDVETVIKVVKTGTVQITPEDDLRKSYKEDYSAN